jgi:hypothetical protein
MGFYAARRQWREFAHSAARPEQASFATFGARVVREWRSLPLCAGFPVTPLPGAPW